MICQPFSIAEIITHCPTPEAIPLGKKVLCSTCGAVRRALLVGLGLPCTSCEHVPTMEERMEVE